MKYDGKVTSNTEKLIHVKDRKKCPPTKTETKDSLARLFCTFCFSFFFLLPLTTEQASFQSFIGLLLLLLLLRPPPHRCKLRAKRAEPNQRISPHLSLHPLFPFIPECSHLISVRHEATVSSSFMLLLPLLLCFVFISSLSLSFSLLFGLLGHLCNVL